MAVATWSNFWFNNRWWKLIPAVLFLLVLSHLWIYEYSTPKVHEPTHHVPEDRLGGLSKGTRPAQIKKPPVSYTSPNYEEGWFHNLFEGLRFGGYKPNKGAPPSRPAVNPTHEVAATEPSSSGSTSNKALPINHNAHRLKDADLLKTHIKAVLSLPPLTVADAKATCEWPRGVQPNFQVHESAEWVQHDTPNPDIVAARQAWYDFIEHGLVPWTEAKGNFSGKGIVIVGGQRSTLPRIKFQLKVLDTYGSELPVELHYWDEELAPGVEEELQQIYPHVTTHDLSKLEGNILESIPPIITGYHMKVNAVINSRFEEVLLLDADNVPMDDPAIFFDSQTYKEYGTVFWPDIARTRRENPMWSVTNTLCRMDEYEQESGQMLVDKRRFFYHLQLSSFFMRETFYSTYLLGDKDMFRFAWHALKTSYGRAGRWIATIGTQSEGLEPVFCGRSFAQHHPDEEDGRIAFMHLNAMKLMDVQSLRYYRDHGGAFKWYKSPPDPYDWEAVVPAGLSNDDTSFMPGPPVRAASCIDFYDERETETIELLPDWEEFFRELGGYEMLEATVGV